MVTHTTVPDPLPVPDPLHDNACPSAHLLAQSQLLNYSLSTSIIASDPHSYGLPE